MNKLMTAAFAALLCTAAVAQPANADGEVTKVDKPASRITLKHTGVKNLDMPPMTMVFRVNDGKLLDNVAVGDKVRFAAEKLNGNYTVTAITKAP